MPMQNKMESLLQKLNVSAYRFAQDTGISANTVYSLKNNPSQFPTADVFDRIITTYNVEIGEIVEWLPDPIPKVGNAR